MQNVVRSRSLTTLLGVVLVLPSFALLATPAAVRADCGTDGIRWPDRPKDVRGAAFIGTALEEVEGVGQDGVPSIRFSVDQVLDGAIGTVVDVTPVCVDTPFVPGQRYLISTTDTLFAPGTPANEPSPGDGHLWFTDGRALAWRVLDGGRVRLLGYGDGAHMPIPAWVRAPATVREVVKALLPRGGDPDPVHPIEPTPPAPEPGIAMEVLGTGWRDDRLDERVELRRTSLVPGARMSETTFVGDWVSTVERGVLTVRLVEGLAVVAGPDGPQEFPGEEPRYLTIPTGGTLQSGPDAVLTWENQGSEPATVLSSAVISSGHEALAQVVRGPEGPDLFAGPVIDRIVLAGPGETGDRYRITVADRSARVIGARVPTARDLRFAGGGDSPVDYRDIGIGPVAYLDGNVKELLVWWTGTPCGPVVTLDVAQDLSALRVVDRTGGCDAAGVRHAVVLRIRGEVPKPEDIQGSWIRRR
jgi:hypothetical protein